MDIVITYVNGLDPVWQQDRSLQTVCDIAYPKCGKICASDIGRPKPLPRGLYLYFSP